MPGGPSRAQAVRMRRPPTLLAGALALHLVGLPAPAGAQEREEILSYDVRVEVQDGGRMVVTEEITVRALGEEIRRGIYRDFPTSFPRASGFGRIQAPFQVLTVERDGRPEPWSVESIGGPGGRGGVRVRIGDPDVLLEHRAHRYRLVYETWRWVHFGETEDQLYWNVTGNGWAFPILEASAAVVLPEAATGVPGATVRLEAWTGPEGSTAAEASADWDASSGSAHFRTTRALEPGEGLTLRLTFPKGVVAPPSPDVASTWFRMDWGGYLDAASVVALVLALYLLMWSRVGRDPPRRPLVVRYEPPDDYSPAALGYLKARGYRDRLFAANLVSQAVQGALTLRREDRDKRWTVERVEGGPEPRWSDEKAVTSDMLGRRRSTVALTPANASTLRKGIGALKRTLSRRLERDYFVLNRNWFMAGFLMSVAGLGALAWRDRYGVPPEAWFFCLWLSIWSIGVVTLLYRAGMAWRNVAGGGGVGAWSEAVFLSLFSLPFVGAELVVLWLLTERVPQHLLLAAAAVGFINILFYHLLERPTLEGQAVMDELRGFEAFLTAADADRLDRLTEPERTPALFERWLPHAIALGVENRWADRFEGVLAAGVAGAATSGSGALSWYRGAPVSDLGGIASSLGSSFSSSLSSASNPPSSGGGGGGGGSSGGGGGGGGGGGW